MKVLIDTNVLISAVLKPDSKPSEALLIAAQKDELFLTVQNVKEFKRFVDEKKPSLAESGNKLLEGLNYTLLPLVFSGGPVIRDKTDQAILSTAVAAGMDIILTGDKDFLSLQTSNPKCMVPTEYVFNHEYAKVRPIIIELAKECLRKRNSNLVG